MALIICPECGKEVTDTVKTCIHCGYPIKKQKVEIPVKKTSILTIVSLVVLVCIVIFILSNRLNDTEESAVQQVENAITKIGVVQINSDSMIIEAEKLYDALSKKCQRHVENSDELLSARNTYNNLKAEETIGLISQIGIITLNSEEVINKAKKSYDALLDEQRELVDNSESLLYAIEQLSKMKVEDVNSKISAIGSITMDSEEKILEARSAYDKLSDEDKVKVSDYEGLVVAEEKYEELAINNCIALIDDIGQVTFTIDSRKSIDNAKKMYNSLSDKAKEKVINYNVLTSADSKYNQLIKEEEDKKKIINPGDSFYTSKWIVTYEKSNISAKILPNSTNGYYMYYYAEDNETFVDVIFEITNIDTDILGIEELVGNCEVEYDGNTYIKQYGLYVSNGSDIDKVYTWDGLDSLDSTTLHVAIVMPRELQTNSKSVKVRLKIAGEEKIIDVR